VLALVALVPFMFFAGLFWLTGIAAVFVDHTQRNDAGYLMEDDAYDLESEGYAVTASAAEVFDYGKDWDAFKFFVGPVRITAEPANGKKLFIGLARTADVEHYLGAVRRDQVDLYHGDVDLVGGGGGAPADSPVDQAFWRDMAIGETTRGIRTAPEAGTWSIVIMNADGSAGVHARAQVGARVDSLSWIGPGLLALGALTALLTVPLWLRVTRT
jgi:hypothetical protein